MNMKDVNKNKVTVTDVIHHLKNELKKNHDVDMSDSQAKNVFIEAVLRNIVLNEIEDMMLYIVDEEKANNLFESRK